MYSYSTGGVCHNLIFLFSFKYNTLRRKLKSPVSMNYLVAPILTSTTHLDSALKFTASFSTASDGLI